MMRPRTVGEKQPYLLGYSAAISVFSPCATAFQLCKVYSKAVPLPRLAALSAQIFPHQTCLKLLQMGVPVPAVRWFRAYLSHRRARGTPPGRSPGRSGRSSGRGSAGTWCPYPSARR